MVADPRQCSIKIWGQALRAQNQLPLLLSLLLSRVCYPGVYRIGLRFTPCGPGLWDERAMKHYMHEHASKVVTRGMRRVRLNVHMLVGRRWRI